jgi:hypothetical protein
VEVQFPWWVKCWEFRRADIAACKDSLDILDGSPSFYQFDLHPGDRLLDLLSHDNEMSQSLLTDYLSRHTKQMYCTTAATSSS